MSNQSSDNSNFALAAIDPGTVTLGLSIGIINIDTEMFVKTYTRTINANILVRGKLIPVTEPSIELRLEVIKKELLNSFNQYEPIAVASESAFFNRFRPNAFKPLLQTIVTAMNALDEYNQSKTMHFFDPPNVKIAVGAKGNAKKEEIRLKVQGLIKEGFFGDIDETLIDEHGYDSLGVLRALYRKLKNA